MIDSDGYEAAKVMSAKVSLGSTGPDRARGHGRRNRRIALAVGALAIFVLFAAWFDGGKEPIRPIVQPVSVEGATP
ncbi:hypothetical protein [Alteripontixanthobacter maritimus]|uniref:hypothetical protein n=1 Tax=Alteripontixanthobacter maritimus TaxID=2161824 RepID=UPI0011C026E1|nr:hypothetical protein [Alteripontixanthobacter maritimus]